MDVKLQILLNVLDEVTKKYDEIFEFKERLLEEANYKSTHDLLTNLFNREYFIKKINRFLENNENFIVAFLDLDNFKYVNDTFGHDAGDEILKNTAEIIRRNIKGKNIAARFGGDEFVIALLNCDIECGKKILENIKNGINKFFKEYEVTASIGIASNKEVKNYEELLKLSDKRMYKSKRDGKNKVIGEWWLKYLFLLE